MHLVISKDKTIQEVQHDFNEHFPFLKLEFYKLEAEDPVRTAKKHLPHSITLRSAGLKLEGGVLDIPNEMKVNELERLFFTKFGLDVQVSRKSGVLWLETTMTDNWTLQKQNEHGREVSMTARVSPSIEDREDKNYG
jgi:hypothetical protein